MTQKQQIEALNQQANHYHDLARDAALEILVNPANPNTERLRFTAQMHLIRAESFRTATKLITGQIKPVSGH